MKINKFLLSAGIAVAAMGFGACTGDLDLLPADPRDTTAASFAEDPEAYLEALAADVLFNYATYGPNGDAIIHSFDGGMSTWQRAIFIIEEIPTDEACWLPAADADYADFQYGIVDATNKAATGAYSRFMVNAALCVDFMRTINEGYFNGTPELAAKAKVYKDMAKALWGASYYYLISNYGNVPYTDENTEIGSTPEQLTQAEVYTRVVAEMEKLVADMTDATPAYGYVGKDMAEAILMRLYLNAEAWTGKAEWSKCLAAAQNIIKRHQGTGFQGSGLVDNYSKLFTQQNQRFAPGGSGVNEILWAIPQNMPNLTSWANSTFMIDAWLGDVKDVTKGDWNSSNGWKCMVARRQFVEVFDWTDDDMSQTADQRVRFWATSAQGFSADNPDIGTQDLFGDNGYLPVKYANWLLKDDGTIDQANSGPALEQFTIDYAMIRLAEVYLSAAEAILNGAGSQADALTYVNYVRTRAGLSAWTASQLTKESLQQERQRELYTEGLRRTDLIRYNKWISGYNWNWKNKVAEGADFNANFKLYPLPSAVCVQAGYTQNPGY